MSKVIENVVIIGSGPAGYTASIYAARSGLEPLIIDGDLPGGQLMNTTDVENYPGFNIILGPDLMNQMRSHVLGLNVRTISGKVVDVDFKDESQYKLHINDGSTIYCKSVIIATGASTRVLHAKNEDKYNGRGVSYCTVCDGFFFKGKNVVVVGGGNSAFESVLFLSRIAKKIYLVHRSDKYRSDHILQERVKSTENVEFLSHYVVDEVLGTDVVSGVALKHTLDNSIKKLDIQAIFINIGHIPNTQMFKGHLELEPSGHIKSHKNVFTSVNRVFVAGDVGDMRYMQAITSAGYGCMAALEVERSLNLY